MFKELRSQSRRGPGSGKAKAAKTNAPKASTPKASKAASAGTVDQGLMKRLAAIEKQLAAIEKKLDKPVQVTLRRG